MEIVLLIVFLAGSLALALGISYAALALVLDTMAGRGTIQRIYFGVQRVAFVVALLWLSYFVPGLGAAVRRSTQLLLGR